MFSFREWVKNDSDKRVYFDHSALNSDGVYLTLLKREKPARLRGVPSSNQALFMPLLIQAGFCFETVYEDWDMFIESLFKLPGNHKRIGDKTKRKASFGAAPGATKQAPGGSFTRQGGIEEFLNTSSSNSYVRNVIGIKSLTMLDAETYKFDISRTPFKESSLKNTQIIVDTREPASVYDKLSEGPLAAIRSVLDVGDIKIISRLSRDHVVIEQKTVDDLYLSVTSDDKRFHRQAERLESYRLEQAAQGIRVLVVWMIEGSDHGSRMLYQLARSTPSIA